MQVSVVNILIHTQFNYQNYRRLQRKCRYEGIFYKFCDDLVESTRAIFEESMGMSFVCKRYNSWKKLFYNLNKTTLSESQQMGLIGELLFLKNDMFKNYTIEEAINSWSGCDKTHKDFSIGDDWYEIKSSASNSLTIKISSLEQLDSETDGILLGNHYYNY